MPTEVRPTLHEKARAQLGDRMDEILKMFQWRKHYDIVRIDITERIIDKQVKLKKVRMKSRLAEWMKDPLVHENVEPTVAYRRHLRLQLMCCIGGSEIFCCMRGQKLFDMLLHIDTCTG